MKALFLFFILFLIIPLSYAKDNKNIVQQLCRTEWGVCGFNSILKCGNYYSANPACADAPHTVYDANGKKIAECGGMPGPGGQDDTNPKCNISCDTKNICSNFLMDCSKLLNQDKKACLDINRFRKLGFNISS